MPAQRVIHCVNKYCFVLYGIIASRIVSFINSLLLTLICVKAKKIIHKNILLTRVIFTRKKGSDSGSSEDDYIQNSSTLLKPKHTTKIYSWFNGFPPFVMSK